MCVSLGGLENSSLCFTHPGANVRLLPAPFPSRCSPRCGQGSDAGRLEILRFMAGTDEKDLKGENLGSAGDRRDAVQGLGLLGRPLGCRQRDGSSPQISVPVLCPNCWL